MRCRRRRRSPRGRVPPAGASGSGALLERLARHAHADVTLLLRLEAPGNEVLPLADAVGIRVRQIAADEALGEALRLIRLDAVELLALGPEVPAERDPDKE